MILLLLSENSFAQSDTARIEGTVTDTQGAVIAGATVAGINIERNFRIEASTDNDGGYVLTPLRVGTYSIEVTAPGFRKLTRPLVVLTVNQVAHIDLQVEPGDINEVVQVSGGAPLVERDTSSLGQVINEQKIVDLPLNGRNFTQLATLVPGVARGAPGGNADGSQGNVETFRQAENGSAALSVNGLREQNNNFQLDGIDNNESIVNSIVFYPPIEALQEFRVITSVAPAEFGRAGGAIINAVLRSGTNDFHGSVFEFLRNSALDARPAFSPNRPLFIRNQFGITFGGPVIHDKTFFFVDFQGLRQRLPIEAGNRLTVPTQLMREGNFSQLLDPGFTGLGEPIIIRNPTTGQPFPGNIINVPLNAAAVNYLKSYPMPDLTDRAQGNFFVSRLRRQAFNDGDVRVDQRFSDRDFAFGRFSIAQDDQKDPGRIPGFQAGFGAGANQVHARSVALNYTRTLSPTLINEARFGWITDRTDFLPVGFGHNQDQQLGISGISGVTSANGISLIGGGDGRYMEYLGDFGQYTLDERSLQFSDALSYVRGKHTLKFGASIIQRHITTVNEDYSKGFYFFSDLAATPGTQVPLGQTGYEVADLLVGKTNFTTTASPGVNPATTISYEDGFFVQDDWRASQRLTLNLGLRYDLFTPPYEIQNRLANFDPVGGRLVLAGKNGASRSTVDLDTNNFGPRVGIAYSLTRDGKTVLRSGYGLFYSLDRGGISNQLTQNPPFLVTQFRFDGPGANIPLSDPIPLPDAINPGSPVLPLSSSLRFQPRNTPATRVQEFNVAFERELTREVAMSVGYVGTRGANVTAVVSTGGFGGDIATRLTTISNVGSSRYDSLQVKVNVRPWHGLSYLAAYTFGRAWDNSPGPFPGIGAGFRTTPADAGGLAPGLADYDVRQRFTFAGVFEVPRANTSMAAANTLLRDWQINTILTFQGGTPFTVFGGFGRASLIGDPHAGESSPDRFFNTLAFGPSTNIADQSPRNLLRSPGIADVDASLFRKFLFTEKTGLEFRAEAFNLFNHPQLGFPNQVCCGGDFGRITTTRLNSERQVQFALRLFF
jgi:hypothetical protein